ncbi:ABC transporter permease [Candidatus Dependentiae bacterium]|nr:ABC transporter permease [Candidatus Dependentiae bacterium]
MKFLKRVIAEEVGFFLTCPAFLWQTLFLYLPLSLLLVYSVVDQAPETGRWFFTFNYYTQIIRSTYVKVVVSSFLVAFATACICLSLAFPIAYFLALKVSKRFRTFLLFSLILPSWTSLVVQAYAWFFLLDQNGLLAKALRFIRLIRLEQSLLNNYTAIIIGMVAVYLPFMIMPLFTAIEKMDKRILEASADLGANRRQTFWRIIFPLSLPGVYAGFLLVFIPAFGEFAIPTLLGGSKIISWGNLIVEKFLIAKDWRAGAAFASFGVLFPVLILLVIYLGVIIVRRLRVRRTIKPDLAQKDVW